MRPATRAVLTCPGRGAARNEVERRTTSLRSCCAAPGTRERRDPLLRRVKNQPSRVVRSAPLFPLVIYNENRNSDVWRSAGVIAGLDPAIHLLRKTSCQEMMDPRVKPGGDGS